ncbi:MAG TPA: MmgE/PrpD family protein [Pseudolabrys sp.]|nr:MmgE/PrpD family protein [Pseudolabrys sp.]
MREEPTRRRLIAATGAALMPLPFAAAPVLAQGTPAVKGENAKASSPAGAISPVTAALCDYVAGAADRELPPDVLAKTRLHTLDTIAAMISGSRLKAGVMAARYVDTLGGKPQATVAGTRMLTSSINAALANGMAAHGDETDDSHLRGRFHPGCGIVPAALACAELANRSGAELLRAIALGYDIGARTIFALGFGKLYTERHSTHSLSTTFGATAAASAMLRLDSRGVRHAFSFAAQQASGVPYWERDREHVEKAFDFGGMGARNGVTAATMIASGMTGVDDFLGGERNLLTAVGGEAPKPQELAAELGRRFEIMNTSIKKWTVGSPLQSVLDGVTVMLEDPAVRAGRIKRIVVDMPADRLHIVDNRTISDICLQHLVAMMLVDGGATFASIHDNARMSDPKVLAVRKLVEAVPNQELVTAVPARQSIITIETSDGRTLSHRTYEVRGTPGNPMSEAEVAAKALDLMAPILGDSRAKDLVTAVLKLERFGPVSGLRPLLQA